MSRQSSSVDLGGMADAKYASGDSNNMNKNAHYQEDNNNNIDKLAADFTSMGCIVDKVKGNNICMETCVHNNTSESDLDQTTTTETNGDDEVAYSDEFEEESAEEEEIVRVVQPQDDDKHSSEDVADISLQKKDSKFSTTSNRSKTTTISGRSTVMSSMTSSRSRRVNMSFSNDRLREIELQNQVLLHKIISAKKNHQSTAPQKKQKPIKVTASAAIQRKHQDAKINYENLILLKKIQRAKSSNLSIRR